MLKCRLDVRKKLVLLKRGDALAQIAHGGGEVPFPGGVPEWRDTDSGHCGDGLGLGGGT